MGAKTFCAVFVVILAVLVAVIPILVSWVLFPIGEVPAVDVNEWWGKGAGDETTDDTSVNEMTIHFSDGVLQDLKERLAKTNFFSNLEGIDWEYGINPDYVKDLVKYWQEKYDWRKQEKILNRYKHFKTKISGIQVHFLHYKPELKEGQQAMPIMFVHGWPGSFYEFYRVIPKLIEASTDAYAFEVICPSIPGYGFSEAAHHPGFNYVSAARVFIKLMTRLGFHSYYVQGGDWGSAVTRSMAIMDPSHVRGLHLNSLIPSAPYGPLSYILAKLFYPEREQVKIFPLRQKLMIVLVEGGYFHLQATRPHSVALAINDSPAGLAAYIVEKFALWSGCATTNTAVCLEACFTKDDLLTNLMIYWGTQSIASSVRLYYETMNKNLELSSIERLPIKVPAGLADYPHEPLFRTPEPWVHSRFTDVVQFSNLPRGGHFAAFEEPELFASDVIEFVKKVEKRILERQAAKTET